jgi:streptomycin 6-kinase
LPKTLPSSEYHGDLTLENILYEVNGGFILIDPLTTEYDSYVFDLAKLMQDIKCKWFIRKDILFFDSKLKVLEDTLKTYTCYYSDYLLILMLMRVLPYTHVNDDKYFVESEIRKLWK